MEKNLIKIAIFSRVVPTKDGRKFTSYSTKYSFKTNDGRVVKYIRVKFTADAFEGSHIKLSDIKRGFIYVDPKCVGCPDTYEIKKDEKNGKDIHPTCWIRGGVERYEEVLKEHEFHFNTEIDSEETADDIAEDEEVTELDDKEQ